MKITESEFRETLEKATVPVVADFYADWCGPCKAFSPIFTHVAEKVGADFACVKINIDEAGALCDEVGLRVVPTIMVFSESRLVAKHEGGFADESALEKFMRSAVK